MTTQLTTFYIGDQLFGFEVMRVQEVTGKLLAIRVPLAPHFIRGLINLRGQIATAVTLHDLFNLEPHSKDPEASIVCKVKDGLFSFIVDAIGDVVEVKQSQFEVPPHIVPVEIRKCLSGIYKTDSGLLSVIDLEKIFIELTQSTKLISPIKHQELL